MPSLNLPPLPQQLPRTQSDWERFVNVFQSWATFLDTGYQWNPATLLNGWTNLSASFNPAGFVLISPNRVACRGLILSGTLTDGTHLLTLPYKPAHEVVTVAAANAGPGVQFARLDVDTSGNVLLFGASGFTPGAGWVSLDNLSFSLLP